jgi:hypothetical protein
MRWARAFWKRALLAFLPRYLPRDDGASRCNALDRDLVVRPGDAEREHVIDNLDRHDDRPGLSRGSHSTTGSHRARLDLEPPGRRSP